MIAPKKFTFSVAEVEGGWEVLVDGERGIFRTVPTRDEAEKMADKWRAHALHAREVQQ